MIQKLITYLQVEAIGMLTCTLTLFFLHDHITILWVFCSVLGFFTGPIIPTGFALTNRYIEMTAAALILPSIGGAIGDIFYLAGIGFAYKILGPDVLWSFQLSFAIAFCIVACIMQCFCSKHGDRYAAQEQ